MLVWVADYGYLKPSGDEIDKVAVASTVFGHLRDVADISDAAAREEDAQTLLDVLYVTFDELPKLGTSEYDQQDGVEREAWHKLRSLVGSTLNTNQSSKLQKMVASMGGYVLCKTQIDRGGVLTDAWYVTSEESLIMADFTFALRDAVRKAAEKEAKNLSMVGKRKPEMAAKLIKELDASMKNATQFAKSTLALNVGTPDDQ